MREIQASVDVLGTAEIQAIPASVLGTAAIDGVATVVPEATKVQPGRAGLDSIAGVSITPAPVVTRYVAANITAGAQGRIETTINDVQEAFAPVAGTAQITLVEVAAVQRMATAQILATTEIAPVATKRQPGRADVPAIAAFMNTDPFVSIGADAAITAGAALWADGVRVRTAGAASTGASTVSASARTRQVAHATPAGSATLSVHGVRSTHGTSTPTGGALVQAEAIRVARAVALLDGAANMFVSSGSLTFAGADVVAECQIDVGEPVFAEQGFADMGGTCWVENTDVRMAEQGQAALGGSCSMQLWDARVNAFVAADLLCSAEMLAEAVTLLNADADVLGQSAGFAEAIVTRPAAAILDSHSLVTADAWRVQLTGADFGGSAQAIAQATDYDRLQIAALPGCTATVSANPKIFDKVTDGALLFCTAQMVVGGKLAERGAAAVQAGVSVVADAVALLSPPAVFIHGNAYITADTVANIASMDPPERTFLRPAYQADFVRTAQETEFRRAA